MRIAHAIPASDPEPPVRNLCRRVRQSSPAQGKLVAHGNMVYDHITMSYVQLACIPRRKTSAKQDCGEKPPREPAQTVSGVQ